jgi:hypothetical protein
VITDQLAMREYPHAILVDADRDNRPIMQTDSNDKDTEGMSYTQQTNDSPPLLCVSVIYERFAHETDHPMKKSNTRMTVHGDDPSLLLG